MLVRIFAILLLLNLAGQAVQAKAEVLQSASDDNMFSWQTGYTASLTQGVAGEQQSSQTGECVRRALMLVVNQLIFRKDETTAQQFNGRTMGHGLQPAQYAMDVNDEGVSLTLGWKF
ncbi:hypothetical protein BTA51_25190 [Hahella sp. CCB-MM4]|uniref:hypothetical protein n=1 Tax=Hahella sp. (strain CCB-MM4) TaxID=1926491 RepID=UPI000B9B8F16|nr:hypothetical protein [Hahella sp. CCB-MM4]OZG70662.1 hypothetical protein BTA51_25190 [Hahella sp. CCB-MM4]